MGTRARMCASCSWLEGEELAWSMAPNCSMAHAPRLSDLKNNQSAPASGAASLPPTSVEPDVRVLVFFKREMVQGSPLLPGELGGAPPKGGC